MALLPEEGAELAKGPLRDWRGRQAKGEGGKGKEEMIRFLIVIRCAKYNKQGRSRLK